MSNTFELMLAQARELQKSVADAVGKATDQLKPVIAVQIENAQKLQASLAEHATKSAEISAQQGQQAAQHVQEFIKMGADAMRDSAEQTRETAAKMAEESRRIVESLTPKRP